MATSSRVQARVEIYRFCMAHMWDSKSFTSDFISFVVCRFSRMHIFKAGLEPPSKLEESLHTARHNAMLTGPRAWHSSWFEATFECGISEHYIPINRVWCSYKSQTENEFYYVCMRRLFGVCEYLYVTLCDMRSVISFRCELPAMFNVQRPIGGKIGLVTNVPRGFIKQLIFAKGSEKRTWSRWPFGLMPWGRISSVGKVIFIIIDLHRERWQWTQLINSEFLLLSMFRLLMLLLLFPSEPAHKRGDEAKAVFNSVFRL